MKFTFFLKLLSTPEGNINSLLAKKSIKQIKKRNNHYPFQKLKKLKELSLPIFDEVSSEIFRMKNDIENSQLNVIIMEEANIITNLKKVL